MTDWIGFAAAAGTTLAFLPQLIGVWTTRSAQDISLVMYLILVLGVALWIVYGFRIGSMPVVVANCATLLLAGGVLADQAALPATPLVSDRVVYRSGIGRICPDCGQAAAGCVCSKGSRADAPIPSKITAKLRLEKKGRAGKSVTVIDALPDNAEFLDELAAALKKACGSGGTTRPGAVELAGDVRERVRPLLAARGFVVKG